MNNAGIAINAPVETLPMDEWRRQFEVNLFGHIAATQAVLPHLIDSSGTVVTISSVGGRVAMPTYGAYAGSKFALEAVSDALRREVAAHGVKVVVVEPGGAATEMTGRGITTAHRLAADMTSAQHARYDRLVNAIVAQAEEFTANGLPAAKVADIIADPITARKPRVRYTVGRDAAVLVRLSRLVPDRLLDRLLRRVLKAHFRTAAPA